MINYTVSDYYTHFTGWVAKDHSASLQKMKSILSMKAFVYKKNERQWVVNSGYAGIKSIALSNFYVQMVCFTETPMSFMNDALGSKGGYCIGMKKEWLIRNGGQNVIYVDDKHPNDYGRTLVELLAAFRAPLVKDIKSQEEANLHSNIVHSLLAATEQIELNHEREWRIIRNDLNKFIANDTIPFEISDIAGIWCLEEYYSKLLTAIQGLDEYSAIKPLIIPISQC